MDGTMRGKYAPRLLLALCALLLAGGAGATESEIADPPIKVKIKNPDGLKQDGVLLTDYWALVLELEIAGAVGIVDEDLPREISNKALILDAGPDPCIDMAGWVEPGQPFSYESGCSGPDETFIKFTPDDIDRPGLQDSGGSLGSIDDAMRLRLQDDAYNPAGVGVLNKQYIQLPFSPAPSGFVGPSTESFVELSDGYGYGVNDDLPGLMIWADVGTGKVALPNMDPYVDSATGGRRLRNMAGLVSSVFYTQLAKNDTSSLVAVMNVTRGVLEPIVQVDFNAVDFSAGGPGFELRLDDGPIQHYDFSTPGPKFQDDAWREVFAVLQPFEVFVYAAVVDGQAGEFIDDLDNNGKFNRVDLELAGYELLSNVRRYRVRAIQEEALESGPFECPEERIYKEVRLDSDTDGSVGCSTGNARSITRPPR